MTNLLTGFNTNSTPCIAAIANQVYFVNDYDPCQVWDGVGIVTVGAGITGPAAAIGNPTSTAAGLTDIGNHQIRYRYQNSKTGYVSNPSPATLYNVVGGAQALTYNIAGGGPIFTTSDTKVDSILVEMTPRNSPTFYQVARVANAAGSYVISIADALLTQNFDSDANYGSIAKGEVFTHSPPPYGTIILEYKGITWVLGTSKYAQTTCTFTNPTANVTAMTVNFTQAWVGRVVRRNSDNVAYVIASGTTGANAMVTQNVYAGTTGSSASVIYSTTPNRGYYSRPFAPEEYYPSVWARDFLQNRNDLITAAIGRKEAMYVFGLFSCERLVYDDNPSALTSVLSPIQGNRGAFNNRCLVEAEGKLYSFDRQGVWLVSEVPEHLSAPIDDTLRETVDYSQYSQFHGGYDPVDRILMFFHVRSGDTKPKYAACLEIDTGRWFFDSWLQGITASKVTPTSDGQVRLMLADQNGYTWFLGITGSFDGVPPTSATVLTVVSSSGPTNAVVTQTLPTTSPTLAGVMAYNPLTDLTAVISSNTATTLTLGAGMVNAFTAAQEIWIGAIAWEYRTKWWTGPGQVYSKMPVYLIINLFPGSTTGIMRVYIYDDFSTVPTVPTAWATDQLPDGVTYVSGTSYLQVDLAGGTEGAGYLSVPLPGDYKRALQARLTSIRPDGTLRVSSVRFAISREADDFSTPGPNA